jgi:hypothetical protein
MTWDGDSGEMGQKKKKKKKREKGLLTSNCALEGRQEHPGSRPF